MARDDRRQQSTAELYEESMDRSGNPPSREDMLALRERQAQRTHLLLHDRVLSGKKSLIAFVKTIFATHDMVWTLWGGGATIIGWDLVKGRALLNDALAPGSVGLARYRETTVRVPDPEGSDLLLNGFGEGRSGPIPFGTPGRCVEREPTVGTA